MKNYTYLITAAAMLLLMGACRTTEANYRAAYEQAVAGKESHDPLEGTIYEEIRNRATTHNYIVKGDTLSVKRERVKLSDVPTPAPQLQKAYVVVAQFKQLFNARSLRDRLKAQGYPDATLLETAEPLYYIAIAGGNDLAQLQTTLNDYRERKPLPVKAPYPLILEPVK